MFWEEQSHRTAIDHKLDSYARCSTISIEQCSAMHSFVHIDNAQASS